MNVVLGELELFHKGKRLALGGPVQVSKGGGDSLIVLSFIVDGVWQDESKIECNQIRVGAGGAEDLECRGVRNLSLC